VQAIANASGGLSTRGDRRQRQRQAEILASQVDILLQIANALDGQDAFDDVRRAATVAARHGAKTLAVQANDSLHAVELLSYFQALDSLRQVVATHGARVGGLTVLSPQTQQLISEAVTFNETPTEVRTTSAVVPAIFLVGPAVNFTLSYEYAAAAQGRTDAVQSLELGTNLVGAAAGLVFDALGEDRLAKYFKENLAVSTGLPLRASQGGGRVYSTAAIGLGEITAGQIVLWPTLSLVQADTSDHRIADSVTTVEPTRASWSVPSLTFGLIYKKWLLCFQDNRCYPPVLVVGLSAPQHYPGNAFEAISALFSGNREKYVRFGNWRMSFGVAVPLRPLTRVSPETKR
jgi:hypothetical protein